MARNVIRMEEQDSTSLDGDGKSTVDLRSTHGGIIPSDGKSTVDLGGYVGPDHSDSPSGTTTEPTSASGVVDPEFQSDQTDDKPKARRGRPPRQSAKADESKGSDSKDA